METSQSPTHRTAELVAQKQHAEERAEDMKDLARGAKGDKVQELTEQITKLKAERLNATYTIATYQDFHELFQNLANLIKKIDPMADMNTSSARSS